MKKIISLVVGLLVFAGILSAQAEYKQFFKFGLAPLIPGGVHSVEEARQHFSKKQKLTPENRAVYLLLDDEKIAEAFFEQIEHTEIKDIVCSVGTRYDDMAFYSARGSVKLAGKVEWGGPRMFRAFSFGIRFENKMFWFNVPKECGNLCISLVEVILPEEEVIEEDLPQEIFNPPAPQIAEDSVFTAAKFKPEKVKKLEYLIDVFVSEFQGCGNEYTGARIGVQYPKDGNLKIFATSGAAFPILTRDGKWKTILLADVGVMVRADKIHLGAGVGFSSNIREEKKDQFEGLINTGLQISKNVKVFFEGRAPFKEETKGARNHRKFLVGLRVVF